jgi:ATP10 protein
MKIKITIATLICVATGFVFSISDTASAQENSDRNSILNKTFPILKAETLTKRMVTFPTDTKGKYTVICFSFTQKTQSQAESWTNVLLAKFPNKEINYYEIPMLETGYKLVKRFIDNGMRDGVDSKLHDFVTSYYRKELLMPSSKVVYLFLLDTEGKIKYSTEGSASVTKLGELYDKINL